MSCPVCSAELTREEAMEAFLSGSDREGLNALKAAPLDDPATELEHFMTCAECGQSFDMRNLGDALHHDQPGHRPIPSSA
jgi:hypothetical protein